MQKLSLDALAREELQAARQTSSGRSARTVFGGHEHVLRQTVIALLAGRALGDHKNPEEATVHVLRGRVRLHSREHRQSKYLNNRAENSHQPTRAREQAMKRFISAGHAQRFLSASSGISPHFRPGRHRLGVDQYRREMTVRFAAWNEVTGTVTAA